jgi:hypothetical protein
MWVDMTLLLNSQAHEVVNTLTKASPPRMRFSFTDEMVEITAAVHILKTMGLYVGLKAGLRSGYTGGGSMEAVWMQYGCRPQRRSSCYAVLRLIHSPIVRQEPYE